MNEVIYPSPSEILSEQFLSKYRGKQPKWGFNGLGYIVYKRTYSRQKLDGTSEEWPDTIERCIRGAQAIGAKYTVEEAERLFDHIFNLRCSFGGRMLWQLGTTTVDKIGLPSLCNCWFVNIDTPESFCFIFEHSMLGGGVGYSVKREHVHQLPKIKNSVCITHKNTKDADFIVPDSREGWTELLRKVLDSFFVTGKSFSYSTVLVRGAGEKITGFGGIASGPQILIDGIANICKIFLEREGRKLRSIDALDIANIIGSIVVSGNVRRSAQLAIGDADDVLFLKAKRWDLGNIPNWRAMSNNTINADGFDYITDQNHYFWAGYQGNGEAYGLINQDLCRKVGRLIDGPLNRSEELYPVKEDKCEGVNPCLRRTTKVLTPDGIRNLEDVNTGDKIWSKQGWTTILNKWSTGIKEVLKYETTAGIFYGTKNHKIVSEGNKIEVGISDSIDIFTGPIPIKLSLSIQDIMDGLIIGDGSKHKASNDRLHLCIGEKDSDYFKSEIKNLIIKARSGVNDYAYEVQTTILAEELDYTYNREIPDRFIYGSAAKVAGFLRGLFSANGSICADRVCLKASSKKIIEQVQLMLSSIGIKSYYTTNKPKEIDFSNGRYLCKESFDLNISVDRNKFRELIGFIQEYKNIRLDEICKKTSGSGKNTYDIIYTESLGEEEVFDITVDNTSHTFWSQGCDISNCGEANLYHGEPCDLAENFLNNIESEEQLFDCSYLLYKTQKAILTLPSISEWTNRIVKKNMRIGLGPTGVCNDLSKIKWFDNCYRKLRKFDKEWSLQNGWNESIKLTVVKPSGTLSLLGGCTPGVHPAYDRYYIRRVRMASNDKLVQVCKDLGYKTEYQINFDGSINHDTIIVEFPVYAGEKAIIAKNMTAIEQLEIAKQLQTYWADQSVSVTVYYKKEELPSIKEWLKQNYDTSVKTVSFLLHQDHGFLQPPYESITKEQYESLIKNIKPIQGIINSGDGSLENMECASGACPIR